MIYFYINLNILTNPKIQFLDLVENYREHRNKTGTING